MQLPAWAQTDLFIIMASLLGLAIIILPLITRALVNKSNRRKQALLNEQWQSEKNQLNYSLMLAHQELEQQLNQVEKLELKALSDQQLMQASLNTYQQTIAQQERQIGQLLQQANELTNLKTAYSDLQEKMDIAQQALTNLQSKYESQLASIVQERKSFDEKMLILKDAETQLNLQFENLANKIFEQKADKFTRTSESGLNLLLSPLKQQIEDFKKQISDQYIKEGQERASLKSEIYSLKELNLQITQEAAALTNALKGDNKQQGNWGELVLARILDESGLREGHEYEIQKQLSSEAGKQFRPDVVVHLPNQKDIIIDSKVSLIAHEKVVNANNEELRNKALKEHILSIKGHIKGLSKKDYQDLVGVKTLDYVLMFVPIESAFINAIEAAPDLVKIAMDRQIMLVSPTNLLVALRTINNIWQYEYQNQHAKTIADKAKNMYDKFAGFVDDMEKIGKNIDTLGLSYEAAMNKLSTGRGNLIGQAESFKKLGVSPTKSINKALLPIDE